MPLTAIRPSSRARFVSSPVLTFPAFDALDTELLLLLPVSEEEESEMVIPVPLPDPIPPMFTVEVDVVLRIFPPVELPEGL